jgi:cytochrome c-type biogenesis protein CcmH/NrfF
MSRGVLLLGVLVAATLPASSAGAHPAERASLPAIEAEVMCPSCGEALNVAQSSQGDREIALIKRLIRRGETGSQIKRALVGQFGPEVLGLPPARGFAATVYVVPALALAFGLILVGVLGRRWRARQRRTAPEPGAPSVSLPQLQQLEEDMLRYRL